MSKLFALLAGINEYPKDIPQLSGCVNDVTNLQAYLENRFTKERRNIKVLKNEEATYESVVGHFGEDLLLQAGKDDIVLFAYSGHGSREKAAPEFSKYFPEGMMETLVLHDSRQSGKYDLGDKELAVLIERIAKKGAHVAVILDCCHSGSGTRSLEDFTLGAARQASDRTTPRDFGEYLNGHFAQRFPNGKDFYLPASRHILLAACDRKEKAWETDDESGLFTKLLLDVLNEEKFSKGITYSNLFTECRIRAIQGKAKQHPQFETYGFFNGLQGFLGLGSPSTDTPVKVYFDANKYWNADMGALLGLPTGKSQPSIFQILADGKPLKIDGKDVVAKTRTIGLNSSTVEIVLDAEEGGTIDDYVLDNDTLSTALGDKPLEAKLISMPEPPQRFFLKATQEYRDLAIDALTTFKTPYFVFDTNLADAPYCMEINVNGDIKIIRDSDGMTLREITGGDQPKKLDDAIEKLQLIARWEKLVKLDNPQTAFNRNKVTLDLILDDFVVGKRNTQEDEVVIEMIEMNGEEVKIPFRWEITNETGLSVHCALLHYDIGYGFKPYFNEPIPWVENPEPLIAMEEIPGTNGDPFKFELRNENETTDIFKLIVSHKPINVELFTQEGFALGETQDYPATRSGGSKGFIGDGKVPTIDSNDWFTITRTIKLVKRVASVGKEEMSIADGKIKILGHSNFKAGLNLTANYPGSRNIEDVSVLSDFAKYAGVEMLQFGNGTKDVAPANTIELTGITNEESLLNEPLQIEIAAKLQDDSESEEFLFPLTFDGEYILPVGSVEQTSDGRTLISISSLPEIVKSGHRNPIKALKLCFFKVVLKKDNVQELRWVDYQGKDAERRSENLRNKVLAANNILLLVHGIIGDTKGMAECMRQAKDADLCDLVLTFDYENLNTPIQDTARKLKEMLEDVGITSKSGKKITIVAHSMGGLVSRYFIENMDGKSVVKHLVMAGTPNEGSAISEITTGRDYALILLGLLMLTPWNIPAAAYLLAILQKTKTLTPTLEQMSLGNNGFLKNLNRSSDPGVKYSIIAGRLHEYLANNKDKQKLMDKLYRTGGKIFYKDKPNDIAVSVESIKAVPMDRKPAPSVAEVACHHLCYFEESVSVKALMGVLMEDGFA